MDNPKRPRPRPSDEAEIERIFARAFIEVKGVDLRKFPRTGIQVTADMAPAQLPPEGGEVLPVELAGIVRDFSQGGLALQSETDLPPGTNLRLLMRLGGEALECRAVVVRKAEISPGVWGYGVAYAGMSGRERAELYQRLKDWAAAKNK